MDLWIAGLANGATIEEEWLPGYISPWQRLMEYCKKEVTYVTTLRLCMGEEVQQCMPNAIGYWQAHGMPTVQGLINDEELHKWRGVGWVDTASLMVKIIWAARDPVTHKAVWWRDERPSENQGQVIWSTPMGIIPLEDQMEVARSGADVRNIKKFTDRMVEEAGGLREVYIPPAHRH